MSGYFARLAQRAVGEERKFHAAPSPAVVGSDAHDPFEAVAPVEPAPSAPRAAIMQTQRSESEARPTPEEPQDLSSPLMAPAPQPAKPPDRPETPVFNPPPMQPQL